MRDGALWRLGRRVGRGLDRSVRRREPPLRRGGSGKLLALHVGCGDQRLEGWVNVDLQDLPAVDVVADVTRGLDFADVDAVFAEHFLEHLRLDAALRFLCEVHRVLAPHGRLRLTTPNLEWVWVTHYDPAAAPELKRAMALRANRAFHGWGHQLLWNRDLLESALLACGFRDLRWHRHGESDVALFRGIERHETFPDTPELPHVLVVEAAKGKPDPERLAAFRAQANTELLDHLDVSHAR
jgi:predicted SAM-dependent methyltransferase